MFANFRRPNRPQPTTSSRRQTLTRDRPSCHDVFDELPHPSEDTLLALSVRSVVKNLVAPPGTTPSGVARRHQELLRHLPSDLSQRIFDELVRSQRLTKELKESFRGCHLLDARLDAYPGLEDDWLEVLCDVAPGLCLISLNGCHALTSSGLRHMSVCTAVTHLNLGKGTFSLSYHRSTWKSPRPFSTFETKPPLPSGFVDSLSC